MKIYLYMKVRYYLPMFEYGKIKRILLVFYRENNQIKENKFFILCMGCSHSVSISQQQDQNFFVKMFTEDQYIDKMLCLILQNDQFRVLIEKQIMQDLKAQLKQIYWAETDKQNLARQLQQHIRYSVQLIDKKKNPKVKVTVQEYGKKFGKDIFTLKQSVQSKNKQMLNSLKFYDEIFKNYQMQFIWLQKKQQTQQAQALYSKQIDELNSMAQQVMNMSESCQQLFFYFSWYLVRGCRKLQQRKDIAQDQKIYKINKILQIILEYINIQYMQTPNSNLKQMQYLFFFHQEDLLEKIQCKVYSNKYLKFQLKGSPQQKQKQLENKIMEMSIQAKKQQHYFGNFLSQICKEQQGYHFKKGLKIKSQQNKQAINRVKQKILFSQNNSHKKDENLDYQSIDQLIEQQRNKKVEQFYKILEQNDTITLRISDLLRARCMFSKIQSINNTTQKIMNKVKKLRSEGQDIEIIQIDNRLKKLTNDMVIKIRIKNVITQFQLMFNNPKCTAKEIYHRAYEISRSKIVSSIFMLFDWHEKLTKRYVSFLDNLFNHEHSQKVLTLDQKRIYQQIRKQSQYDKLVQKNPTIPDHQKQKIKNDITSLIFLNSVIDYMKVENLLKKVQERTSDYYFENKQFNKSKRYLLKQYEKQKQSEQKKRILIKKQTIQTVWTRLSTSDRNDSRHSTGNREIESPTFKKTNEKFIIK